MKKRRLLGAWALALASSTPALAQLAPPNDIGVALGHIHVAVKDVEAQKPFWTTMLGGTLVTNGPLTLIQFPGLKFEAPPRQVPNSRTKVAFLTDPWGTYIEVTEGLAP